MSYDGIQVDALHIQLDDHDTPGGASVNNDKRIFELLSKRLGSNDQVFFICTLTMSMESLIKLVPVPYNSYLIANHAHGYFDLWPDLPRGAVSSYHFDNVMHIVYICQQIVNRLQPRPAQLPGAGLFYFRFTPLATLF